MSNSKVIYQTYPRNLYIYFVSARPIKHIGQCNIWLENSRSLLNSTKFHSKSRSYINSSKICLRVQAICVHQIQTKFSSGPRLYIEMTSKTFCSAFMLQSVYCHISTFSTMVQKTYIQYKSSIRTQYDIIHNIIYMAMGARNPYRLVSSISHTQFLFTVHV